MLQYDGVGLSANQIGIQERAFVMMCNLETNETITCFNPKIIKESKKTIKYDEGCLSYPDVFIKIERPKTIVVKYEDENKKVYKQKLKDAQRQIKKKEQKEFNNLDEIQTMLQNKQYKQKWSKISLYGKKKKVKEYLDTLLEKQTIQEDKYNKYLRYLHHLIENKKLTKQSEVKYNMETCIVEAIPPFDKKLSNNST